MNKRQFAAVYNRARRAYHVKGGPIAFDSLMDGLAMECSDEQWAVVETGSAMGFPILSDVVLRRAVLRSEATPNAAAVSVAEHQEGSPNGR